MEQKFIYILAIMILSSISIYIFLAFHYIKSKEKLYKHYINQLIAASNLVMLGSLLFVLKLIIIEGFISDTIMIRNLLIFLCMGFCIVAMYVLVITIKNGGLLNATFVSVIIINSIVFIFFIVTDYPLEFYYNIIIVFYTVANVAFVCRALMQKKLRNNIGIYYILVSFITIISFQLFVNIFTTFVLLAIELALMVLSVVGLFVFYNKFYVIEIEGHHKDIEKKAKLLRESNSRLEKIVFFDEVTTIPNRVAFEKSVGCIKTEVTFVLVNIKNFMIYNNLIGFTQGNELLKQVALTVSESLPDYAQLYRYYSDKFFICIETIDRESVKVLLEEILEDFRSKMILGFNIELYFAVLADNPYNYVSVEEFMNHMVKGLEIASIEAKEAHRLMYEFTEADLLNHQNVVNLEIELNEAIEKRSFEVFYQPQVRSSDYKTVSYEALIRWCHKGNYISPAIFIPMAEANGRITLITHYVIEKVFSDIMTSGWLTEEKVSINLSAVQLIETDLVEYINHMSRKYPISLEYIIFEITETTLFNDVDEVRKNIRRLRDIGFEFSLDDFGAGYSSLYRFAKLEIEEVKFDKIFVDGLLEDEKLRLVFKNSVDLFKKFGMRIVAEGVETKEQVDILSTMNIDLYQGFYFSRPKPLKNILEER